MDQYTAKEMFISFVNELFNPIDDYSRNDIMYSIGYEFQPLNTRAECSCDNGIVTAKLFYNMRRNSTFPDKWELIATYVIDTDKKTIEEL